MAWKGETDAQRDRFNSQTDKKGKSVLKSKGKMKKMAEKATGHKYHGITMPYERPAHSKKEYIKKAQFLEKKGTPEAKALAAHYRTKK